MPLASLLSLSLTHVRDDSDGAFSYGIQVVIMGRAHSVMDRLLDPKVLKVVGFISTLVVRVNDEVEAHQ